MSGASRIMSGPVSCAVCERHAESTFRVEGLDCHEEVSLVDRQLRRIPGVEALSADVMAQRVRVSYDAARTSAGELVAAVNATGLRAWVESERADVPVPAASLRRRVRLTAIAGGFLAVGIGLSAASVAAVWPAAAFLACTLVAGSTVARRALASIRARTLDINALMMIAVIGALAIGEWFEGATVVFLFSVAQLLEARSMDRARHAIRSLMDLAPGDAVVVRDGQQIRTSVDDVAVGEQVVVLPGARVPLDGTVVSGMTEIDESPVTGESRPVPKESGAQVFAGTINGRGAIELEVTRRGRDSTIARIIHLVEEAQARRAPAQAFVDQFARYYTPAVLATAVLIAAIPPLVAGAPALDWVYRALVLLVIACPCALVISTPVAFTSALATAARRGVLVKGGVHLERAALARCVAFDKTGTLTEGTFEVVATVVADGWRVEDVLGLASALESRAGHPLGAGIVAYAREQGVASPLPERVSALPGRGAIGTVQGRDVVVGSRRLLEEHGIGIDGLAVEAERLAAGGSTTVFVAVDREAAGVIALGDGLRAGAREAIDRLRAEGVRHIVLLTGDSAASAGAIAERAGIDEVMADLLPERKADVVGDLQRRHGLVVMVGDGVNDAPALAAADVGVGMGVAGSDAALETADIALMADELERLPFALRLSRRTRRTVQVNIAFALLLKAVFLGLAVAGVATLWMAVVADMGASLIVVGNGLRLMRVE